MRAAQQSQQARCFVASQYMKCIPTPGPCNAIPACGWPPTHPLLSFRKGAGRPCCSHQGAHPSGASSLRHAALCALTCSFWHSLLQRGRKQ